MIRVELRLLLLRRRTWMSVLMLATLPVIVAIFLKVSGLGSGSTSPVFLAEVIHNGTWFPIAALALVLPLFLPVAVLLLAGEAIAGEATAGTLRYLVIRPVGRGRLLAAKLIGIISYLLIAVTAVTVTAFVVGWMLFGLAPVKPLGGTGPPLSLPQAAVRIGLSALFVAASMLGIVGVGLFLSVITSTPLAATFGALGVLVTAGVLDQLPAAAAIQPYLPTHYWMAFVDLFRAPVNWSNMKRGVLLEGGYGSAMIVLARIVFGTRDITS
ncbi:ABC transporter permease [Frankia sp. Cppng1_Ct_nod]|uniref:ABC transporter permease n=1 Tax=Frankia sp. Cppng1_Ct_nod TaxID=2897162 RepID=UPI0010414493|nr:ABC transporter permease [Frankia sp. Cppng1_Ct_nod]